MKTLLKRANAIPRWLHLRTETVEVRDKVSLTRPEQVQPLVKLLQHRERGIPVPYFNGVFSDQETPDIFKMDFVEIAELRDLTASNIEAAKEDFHALTKRYEELKNPPKEEKKPETPEVVEDSKP